MQSKENDLHIEIWNLSGELDQLGARYWDLTKQQETVKAQLAQVKDRIQKLIENKTKS